MEDTTDIHNILANASRDAFVDKFYYNEDDRERDRIRETIKRIKSKALGFHDERIFPEGELAKILVDVGVTSNPEEAKKILPILVKSPSRIDFALIGCYALDGKKTYLQFGQLKDERGNIRYSVSKMVYVLSDF